MTMIVCVAIIDKNNNPLFIKSFNSQTNILQFHYIVHSSLDIFENKEREGQINSYLGMLYPTEDYKVYGYVTNTKIKFVIVIDDVEVKDPEIRIFFEKLHILYVRNVCNPFYTISKEITSENFKEKVMELVIQNS
eukprot:TRINITY_DN4579_c5_g1_i1.p1 TRINITY_DN4579_c5_g1~~TRINITY_DN4579_c5_g1_i1.p1  ORF type:complete len:135 (+),score=10.79 TRINITY_DN4579_c5_g1_i1:52-456(+)